jgi:cell division protein FtsN
MLVDKLKAKGYPAVLNDQASDGWNRVMVGPFSDADSAKAMQEKLEADGLKTLLRRSPG